MKKTLLLLALGIATAGATEIQSSNDPAAPAQRLEQAKAGEGQAMEKIGEYYEKNEDFTSAREWYEKAGAAGNANGYWHIGALYMTGKGEEQNFATAKAWFEKQVAAGDGDGYRWVGLLYRRGGPGLERDWGEAKKWF